MSSDTDPLPDDDAFAASARDLLARLGGVTRLRRFADVHPSFDRAAWKTLAEAGWLGITVPEAHGGLGLGLAEVVGVLMEFGRAPGPEPLISAGVHPVALLCALEASPLRNQLLERIVAGDLIVGVAWQERRGELEPGVQGVENLSAAGERPRLTGEKRWVCPGADADGWLVLAQGPALFWVEPSEGVTLTPQRRVDGSAMGELRFDRAPADLIVQGPGVLAAMTQANDMARAAQGAELLGIAARVHELTLDHLRTRVQFGKPLGANQALQHRMADAFVHLEIAKAALGAALAAQAAGTVPLARAASRVKARTANLALQLTRLAVQMHGAIGITDELDVGLYWKRAVQISSWLGGPSDLQARHLRLQRDEQVEPDASFATEGTDDPFRRSVRDFLRDHYPPHLRHPARRLRWHEVKDWYRLLSEKGWIAPAWPKAYGGMGLPPEQQIAYIEEFEAFGAARLPDQGIINLGPLLIEHGAPHQRAKWLPPILRGEHIWCQGYSEPGAGSDLAALQTKAVRDGENFVVTGSKIWTTLAHDATHIFVLVRTDQAARKQEGISFLLADLKTPGITVRPIRNMAGDEEFCEVFFDGARVPAENIVGEINAGWSLAKSLLGFERLFVGSPATCRYALNLLRSLGETRRLFDDAAFRAVFAELELDTLDLAAAYARFANIVKRGEPLPPSVSVLKIWATETYSRIAAKLVEFAAEDGGSREQARLGHLTIDVTSPLFNATVTTIYGGANEIQKNIISRQVLGLPSP